MLITDANELAVSVILSLYGHLFMYLSRKLTSAQTNYSNIEKDALAIVWCTEKTRQFVLGRKFLLKSDHEPLEFIFNTRKELSKLTSSRILRWEIKLMVFDFDTEYVKSSTILYVDALSRLKVNYEKRK